MGEASGSGLFVLLGPRGSGKSYALRHLAAAYPRLVVLDPLWEHGDLAPEVVDIETLADLVVAGGPGRWRVCTSGREDGDDVAAVALALRGGALVVDEADLWLDANPDEHWVEQIERGRHYGVTLFVATRRPYLIWRAATANATAAYQFRCFEGRDLAWWKSYAGTEAAELVAALEPFQAVHFATRTGEVGLFRAPGLRVVRPAPAPAPVWREEETVDRDVDEDEDDDLDEEAEEVG